MPVPIPIRIGMLLAIILASGSGCTTKPPSPPLSPPDTAGPTPASAPSAGPSAPPTPPTIPLQEPSGALSLRTALALTLAQNPELSVFSWQIRVTEAQALQAALRPNPEAGIEIENALGTGEFRGARETETTLQLSQLVELGRKRAARMTQAQLHGDLIQRDYQIAKITTLAHTADAFIDVLSLQEQLTLSSDTVELARQTLQAVTKRVEAARTFAVEQTKAQVALNSAQVEHDQVQRALHTARLALAAHWGNPSPTFERAEGNLRELPNIPSLQTLIERLHQNPELARATTEISARQAAVRLERARRIPDLTLGGGYRRLNGPDENALVASVSVPLPLFNRGQHAVQEAESRLRLAEEEQRVAQLRAATQLRQAWQRLDAAHSEAAAIRDQILPGAQQSSETISQYYNEGRISYLDVLDAQRTLFATRSQFYRALQECHHARIAIDRLVGQPIDP